MAKYQKYAEYKDSGEWLGEIPLHWDIQPTKRFFRLIAEPAPDNNSYELLSVYTGIGVKPRKELEQKGNKASTTDGYWVVKKGDIVVNKLLAWMGAVGYSEYDGVTSPAYDILRPTKKLNPKFYHYLFRTKIANMEFKRWSRGIMEMRLRLYFDELGRIFMPFPTFEEQNKIVDFLDHETAKIDTLIAKQEKLIELLKEKRQAVISHAVTKGLNPNVPMKDSGVEWLGEVPNHWKITKLSYVANGFNGDRGSNYPSGEDFIDDGIPFISTSDLISGKVLTNDASRITEDRYNLLGGLKIKYGDIIYCLRGSVGKNGICEFNEGTIASALMGIRCNSINPYYLLLLLNSSIESQQRANYTTGSVSANLSAENVMSYKFAFPPEKEQLQIVENLKMVFEYFDQLITKAESAIQLMQERRTALISAAVTGKIDVCNWQHSNQKNNNNTELSA